MKLLLDENLSHRLVPALVTMFPGSAHVRDFALERADDATIWDFAKQQGFTIVSKDEDFHHHCFLYGQPPKVIWLRLGNCSTEQILEVFQRCVADFRAFDDDPQAAFLVVS